MVWLQVNLLVYLPILANMKLPSFILGIYMVFPIISIFEKFNVILQSKTITVSLMISSLKSVIQKLQECSKKSYLVT